LKTFDCDTPSLGPDLPGVDFTKMFAFSTFSREQDEKLFMANGVMQTAN